MWVQAISNIKTLSNLREILRKGQTETVYDQKSIQRIMMKYVFNFPIFSE